MTYLQCCLYTHVISHNGLAIIYNCCCKTHWSTIFDHIASWKDVSKVCNFMQSLYQILSVISFRTLVQQKSYNFFLFGKLCYKWNKYTWVKVLLKKRPRQTVPNSLSLKVGLNNPVFFFNNLVILRTNSSQNLEN